MSAGSRERFEQWAESHGYYFERREFAQVYVSPRTHHAWLGWQAALYHQAPSVAVSELEALDRWDVFAECGYNGSGYVERQVYADGEFIRHDDLRTLINKAGSDET